MAREETICKIEVTDSNELLVVLDAPGGPRFPICVPRSCWGLLGPTKERVQIDTYPGMVMFRLVLPHYGYRQIGFARQS